METIKSVIGLGKGTQEGQEPISGETGAGTAEEPYDQGNQEGRAVEASSRTQRKLTEAQTIRHVAASHLKVPYPSYKSCGKHTSLHAFFTDADTVTGNPTIETPAANEPTASGKSEEHIESSSTTATNPPSTDHISETPTKEVSSGDTTSEKPSIGSPSWFQTAIPFSKRKEDSEGATSASAATTNNAQESAPGHLVDNVSSGHSTNEAAVANMADTHPNVAAPTASEDPMARAADGEAQSAARDVPQVNCTNADNERNGNKDGLFANPFKSAGNNESVETSTAERRRASREAYGSNPNAIPTAGGVRIGSVQYERRMSQVQRKSMEQPKIDEARSENTNQSFTSSAIADEEEPKPKDSGVGGAPTSPTQASKQSIDETPRSMSKGSAGGSEKKKKGLLGKIRGKLHDNH